jgi:hypothetical protein
MELGQFPLGFVIAERALSAWSAEGQERRIKILLGAPVEVPAEKFYRCPFQIFGLNFDERIFAPAGEDPFVALYYALDLIGQLLDRHVAEAGLELRHKVDDALPRSWIWRYSS